MDKVIGRPFVKGHKNTHDVAAAGRKGKANSPWRKRHLFTPGANAAQVEWEAKQRKEARKTRLDLSDGWLVLDTASRKQAELALAELEAAGKLERIAAILK